MEELNTIETTEITQEEKKWCVYIHTSPSGKVYIGITSKNPPEQRWLNGRGYNHNYHFTNAIKFYGWNNFKHEIIAEQLTSDEAETMERELIEQYNAMDQRYGYNLTSGGEKGKEFSQETRDKISQANKNPTEETRQKMSASAKARCTEEWRRIMSERNKTRNIGENNPNYKGHDKCKKTNRRKNKTDNNNANRATPTVSRWAGDNNPRHLNPLCGADNPRARPIVQLTKDGEFIRKWDYVTLAADFLGVKPWNIITCCSRPDKLKTAYGFKWMYLEEYEKQFTTQND